MASTRSVWLARVRNTLQRLVLIPGLSATSSSAALRGSSSTTTPRAEARRLDASCHGLRPRPALPGDAVGEVERRARRAAAGSARRLKTTISRPPGASTR